MNRQIVSDQPLPKLSSLTLPWPADWSVIFGIERPLIVEIGFGRGHFLRYLHRQHPDANIVGLEINNASLGKMEKAIPREAMTNVRVVRSRAETALHHLFTPGSIREVHVNFPDPWFKKRHAGRRLMQRDTLDAIASRLEMGGMFYLATDILEYAEMSAELLESTSGLTNTLDSRWINETPGRIVTKYERKARQAGRKCYYFAYRRNDQPPEVPVIKELDMPHMVIKTPLGLDEMLARIETNDRETDYAEGETRINFVYKYRGADTLLFEVYVHEPTIEQRTGIVLVAREQPDEYTLKLSGLGNPRPTEGLHKAVALLGEKLLNMHPDAEVIHNKVRR